MLSLDGHEGDCGAIMMGQSRTDLVRLALICGFGRKHVVSRQRTPDPLERELTHRLDCHGILDCHQYARTDEDLPWLGFVAKPRGHVGHRPDGGIIEAPLESDSPERSKAVCDADAEANFVA